MVSLHKHFLHHCHIPAVQTGLCWQKSRLHSLLSQHSRVSLLPPTSSHKTNFTRSTTAGKWVKTNIAWSTHSLSFLERKLHHSVAVEGSRFCTIYSRFLDLDFGFCLTFLLCVSKYCGCFRYDNCCCFIFLNLGQYTVTKLSLGLLCIGGQNNSKHKGGVNQVWMNVPLFVFCLETSVIVPLNWTELCCPRRRHEAAEVDISEKQWFPRLGPAPPGNWF